MFKNKNLVIGSIIIILLLLASYFIYQRGVIDRADKQAEKEIQYIEKEIEISQEKIDSIKATVKKQIDSVEVLKEVIVEVKSKYKEIEKPKDTVCLDLYEQYVESNDNLKKQIDIQEKIIVKQDTIINGLHLIIKEKDYIILNKDKHIKILEDTKKVDKKRFGIGGQAGTTYSGGKVTPYVGVGVSYNLIRF